MTVRRQAIRKKEETRRVAISELEGRAEDHFWSLEALRTILETGVL